jgi:hypothetical protein
MSFNPMGKRPMARHIATIFAPKASFPRSGDLSDPEGSNMDLDSALDYERGLFSGTLVTRVDFSKRLGKNTATRTVTVSLFRGSRSKPTACPRTS